MPNPLLLLILDGWGLSVSHPHNAISQARLQFMPYLWNKYPRTQLSASSEHVGLPKPSPGNSQAGHFVLGTGQPYQSAEQLIDSQIEDGTFFLNPTLLLAAQYLQHNSGNLHLVGSISKHTSTSQIRHLFALLRFLREHHFSRTYIHAVLNGQNAGDTGSAHVLAQVENELSKYQQGQIASVTGQYWLSQDGSGRRRFIDSLLGHTQDHADSISDIFTKRYSQSLTDSYFPPTNVTTWPHITGRDIILFLDHSPKILGPVVSELAAYGLFTEPELEQDASFQNILTLTPYAAHISNYATFSPRITKNSLSSELAANGFAQLKISPESKADAVAIAFNGNKNDRHVQEEVIIHPATSNHELEVDPWTPGSQLAGEVINHLQPNQYPFILANFPFADQMAHTGNLPATITACQVIDYYLAHIVPAAQQAGYTTILTSDHGHVEDLSSYSAIGSGGHTENQVPWILIPHSQNTPIYMPSESLILGHQVLRQYLI